MRQHITALRLGSIYVSGSFSDSATSATASRLRAQYEQSEEPRGECRWRFVTPLRGVALSAFSCPDTPRWSVITETLVTVDLTTRDVARTPRDSTCSGVIQTPPRTAAQSSRSEAPSKRAAVARRRGVDPSATTARNQAAARPNVPAVPAVIPYAEEKCRPGLVAASSPPLTQSTSVVERGPLSRAYCQILWMDPSQNGTYSLANQVRRIAAPC